MLIVSCKTCSVHRKLMAGPCHVGVYPGPPGTQSPVYYPGSVRIPNGEYPPPSVRIPNGDYPLGSMRTPIREEIPGLAATPMHMGMDSGIPMRPTSASWREPDGLSAALLRNRDSELADIFAAACESTLLCLYSTLSATVGVTVMSC